MEQTFDGREFRGTLFGGAVSGFIGRLCFYPVDTCKARIQVVSHGSVGIWATASRVIKLEGISGLYRGFGVSAFGSIPATCLYFGTFEVTRTVPLLRDCSPFIRDFTAGFVAEAVSCLIWVPVDVSKERLQTQSLLKVFRYTGSANAIKTILFTDGVRQLYRGYYATLLSFGPFSALYFMFYEYLKRASACFTDNISAHQANPTLLGVGHLLALGSLSAAAAAFATAPLDLVKTRLQVQARTSHGKTPFLYKNFASGCLELLKKEKFGGAFKGSFARVLFIAPCVAVTVTCMETSKGWYLRNMERPCPPSYLQD